MTVPKIAKSDWRTVDGVHSMIARDSHGNELVAIPSEAFQVLAGEAKRQLAARELKERGEAHGPWHPAMLLRVQTWNVGTTDSGTVALILDQGLDTEVQYGLSAEYARQLADLLREEADRAAATSSRAH